MYLNELIVIIFFICLSVLFTVRVTRAPMGTKATPTASHSVCIPTRIHNADAQPLWCQLPRCPFIFDWHPLPPPNKKKKKLLRATSSLNPMSDHYGFMDRASEATEMPAVTSWQQLCRLDEALHSAPDLKWTKTEEHFVGGRGRGECRENRCDGLVETCFNVIAMILTSLNSPEERVFFHVELRGIRENLTTSTVSVCLCVCLCVSGQSGFSFLRDYSSLLCKTIWPCAVKEWVWLNITLCNRDMIGCPVRLVLVDHSG